MYNFTGGKKIIQNLSSTCFRGSAAHKIIQGLLQAVAQESIRALLSTELDNTPNIFSKSYLRGHCTCPPVPVETEDGFHVLLRQLKVKYLTGREKNNNKKFSQNHNSVE